MRLRRAAPQAGRFAGSGVVSARSGDGNESGPGIDPQRAQHLTLERRRIVNEDGVNDVTVNEAESPLAWLVRRKGRDGRALIEPEQFLAGERLRSDFTRAQLMPRTTSNWNAAVASGARGASPSSFTDAVIGARQQVRHALDAAGPEFSGLLLDVCCFLKGLADVERERNWPLRSAKVVLQLGLTRLARHYGLRAQAGGHNKPKLRTWLAEDVAFTVGVSNEG
ncbi:MAG: DUF6456 domain-containing protein [Fimbriimonadaceae bacterium]